MTAADNRARISTHYINKLKTNVSGWLILIPGLIIFAFFIWEPLLASIRLSLYTTNSTMDLVKFVGFTNYKVMFYDSDFLPALRNTFVYTFWSLIIGFMVPIFMAMFLNEVVHLKGFFRVGTYLPNVVPGLAVAIMWIFIYNPGPTGVLNLILSKFGILPQPWLSDPKLTIILIIIVMTWQSAGATALIYLAGLQGINPELYEAAAIDGAGIFKRVRYITFPNIYNLARTLLLLQFISVFQILFQPLVLTQGGPNDASISMMLLVYKYAFVKFDYPKGAALSVIIGIILLIITMFYNRIARKNDI
jgi:multiple sugar transport system permease protein